MYNRAKKRRAPAPSRPERALSLAHETGFTDNVGARTNEKRKRGSNTVLVIWRRMETPSYLPIVHSYRRHCGTFKTPIGAASGAVRFFVLFDALGERCRLVGRTNSRGDYRRLHQMAFCDATGKIRRDSVRVKQSFWSMRSGET